MGEVEVPVTDAIQVFQFPHVYCTDCKQFPLITREVMLGYFYASILRTIDKPVTADCLRLVAMEMWGGSSCSLIARNCKLSESTVHKWFSGRKPISKEGVKNFVNGLNEYTMGLHGELSGTTMFLRGVADRESARFDTIHPESSTRTTTEGKDGNQRSIKNGS